MMTNRTLWTLGLALVTVLAAAPAEAQVLQLVVGGDLDESHAAALEEQLATHGVAAVAVESWPRAGDALIVIASSGHATALLRSEHGLAVEDIESVDAVHVAAFVHRVRASWRPVSLRNPWDADHAQRPTTIARVPSMRDPWEDPYHPVDRGLGNPWERQKQ